jgi:predicted aldo/keto reductase-like oxidoreductase
MTKTVMGEVSILEKVQLGKTGLFVTRTAFGALPIQRADMDTAVRILRRAFEAGINFFDTAIRYTDSEEKLGRALGDVRSEYVLASKTPATTRAGVMEDVHKTLERTRSDYIDLYQHHNPASVDYDDPQGAYAGMLEAKQKGYVRHIGVTSHSPKSAVSFIESGKFATLQFPFNYLSGPVEMDLLSRCEAHGLGFIAMKALSGGMVANVAATFTFIRQHPIVVPIYGIQHEWELEEFIALDKNPPALDEGMQRIIDRDRQELASEFCRACGYCMPCPVGINIPTSARIALLATRSPSARFLTEEFWQQQRLVEDCIECNQCVAQCPYGLDTPAMLKHQHAQFVAWLQEQRA